MNAVTPIVNFHSSLPAFMRRPELLQQTESLGAAFESRAFARVSTEDNRFSLVSIDGDVMPVMQIDPARNGSSFIDLTFIAWSPTITKAWYDKPYEKGSDASPSCSSSDGVRPDPASPMKQAEACAGCPRNFFRSASNGRGKSCSDSQRTAIILAADTPVSLNQAAHTLKAGETVFGYRLPPMTAKYLRAKVNTLKKAGIPAQAVRMRAYFIAQGEVDFDFLPAELGGTYLPEDLWNRSQLLAASEDTERALGTNIAPVAAPAQPALPPPPVYVAPALAAPAVVAAPAAVAPQQAAPVFAPAPVVQTQPAPQATQRKRRTKAQMAADNAAAAAPQVVQVPQVAQTASAPFAFAPSQPAQQQPAAMAAAPGPVIQQPAASSPDLDALLDGIMGAPA